MKKKAFTLVELLAVIVILALVLAIAIPTIGALIENSRRGSFKASAEMVLSSSKLFLLENNEAEIFYFNDGVQSSEYGKVLNFQGDAPKTGIVAVYGNDNITIALHNGTYCATKSSNEPKVSIREATAEECVASRHLATSDSWQTIADNNGVTLEDLLAANSETDSNSSTTGRDIVVPIKASNAAAAVYVEPYFGLKYDDEIIYTQVVDSTPGSFSGTGTAVDPYLVQSMEDLVFLGTSLAAGTSYAGKFINLTYNFDFNNPVSYVNSNTTTYGDINGNGTVEGLMTELTSGAGWNPIGTNAKPFNGTLGGNMFVINNLYINRPTVDYVGLFGQNSGAINALVLKNVNVTGKNYVAGLAGNNTYRINEVEVTGNVTGGDRVGLLAGNSVGHIYSSVVNGNVSGATNVGGVVGYWDYTSGFSGYFDGNFRAVNMGGNVTATGAGVGRLAGGGYGAAFGTYFAGYSLNTVKVNGATVAGNLTSNQGADFASITDLINLNMMDTVLDTYIGGDNDGNGYYWDYDNNNSLVRKNILVEPLTFTLAGAGTTASPYLVNSYAEYKQATQKLTSVIKINGDIDFAGKPFYMLGSKGKAFSGTLFGEGHTLSNIAITAPKSNYVGFSGVNGGTIKGLVLNNIQVSGIAYIGGIAGHNNSVITDSMVKGTITATGDYAGMVAGVNRNAQFVVAEGNVTGASRVGGLTGSLPELDFIMYGVYKSGNVTATGAKYRSVGEVYYGYESLVKMKIYAAASSLVNGVTVTSTAIGTRHGKDASAADLQDINKYIELGFNTTDETKDYIWYMDNGVIKVRPGNL